MPLTNSYRLCALFFCTFLALAGLGLWHFMGASPDGKTMDARYYRAVYLLRHLSEPAASERETIPARVAFDDETESLLHHSDKILVLRHVAEELADIGQAMPRSALYEAYARLGLGERENAARILMRYVVDSDFNAAHYALLCQTLYELEDYPSLLMICREWSERAPLCHIDRSRHAFAALYNLGRFSDAARFMRAQEACLGWQTAPYIAKALLALGDQEQSEAVLQNALVSRYAQAVYIQRLWEQIRDRVKI